MRNLTVVVAWHRGSPKVSTSCTDPRSITLSLENPHRQALTGSSFSLSMPILSKAGAKMMSADASGPSWLSWTLHLLQTLRRLHGFLLKAADTELGLADEVVVAGLAPALLRPRNG